MKEYLENRIKELTVERQTTKREPSYIYILDTLCLELSKALVVLDRLEATKKRNESDYRDHISKL